MRIDLQGCGTRGVILRAALGLLGHYIGTVPGPMLFLSYRLKQMPRGMVRYMLRSVAQRGSFTKSERELLATFISDLNSCHF